MTKEQVIKEFTALKGVGKAKAELLYDHGFDSLDKLKQASVQTLTDVKGISKANAEDILSQVKPAEKTKPKKATPKPKTTPKKTEKKPEAKQPKTAEKPPKPTTEPTE